MTAACRWQAGLARRSDASVDVTELRKYGSLKSIIDTSEN